MVGRRFTSPYINRFLQPDTIIPDQSNPQSWNRFAYVTNRPVNLNDLTGHCPGVIICAIETINAALFLSVRMMQNGGLTDSDFGDAANYAVPTIASASKESFSLSYGVHVAPTVRSISLVTTARGEAQFFHEKTETTNISTAHINAVPIDNTHYQLNGKGLLICRLLSMCGAAQ